jgi:acetolactate synthase-1/2/3 large subunit
MHFRRLISSGSPRSITKYGVTVRNREDLGRIIKEAFYIARTGKPGPVLIDLPKDVMAELGSAEYPKTSISVATSLTPAYTSDS